MGLPPTCRIAKYRKQTESDADEIEGYLCELVSMLKKACHLVR